METSPELMAVETTPQGHGDAPGVMPGPRTEEQIDQALAALLKALDR